MENGQPSGNGDRRNRRRTVSGAIPRTNDDEGGSEIEHTPTEAMRSLWSPPSAPTSPTEKTSPSSPKSGHKRSFSNTIFSRLNFLRNNSEEGRPPSRGDRPSSRDKEPTSPVKSIFSRKSIDDDVKPSPQTSPTKLDQGTPDVAVKQGKTRKRKGSLRKTALLGGRRILSDAGGRERKGSFTLLQRPPPPKQLQRLVAEQDSPPLMVSPTGTEQKPGEFPPLKSVSSSDGLRRMYSYEHPDAVSSSESGWSEPAAVTTARLALLTDQHQATGLQGSGPAPTTAELSSPVDIKSPTSQASYTSTTSDDDVLTFSRPSKIPPLSPGSVTNPSTSALTPSTSYFPSSPSLHPSSASRHHSRSTKSKRSPLSRTLSVSTPYPPPQEPHDYAETAYWGWTILAVTWVTFTVGMGSCLEIWSWAWDVGETPYAPPELEDDPTLPIVGYYPALMVLTGVVAWVWITVAWVGMKYFRHAKIEV